MHRTTSPQHDNSEPFDDVPKHLQASIGLTRVVKYTYLDAVVLKTLAVGRAAL